MIIWNYRLNSIPTIVLSQVTKREVVKWIKKSRELMTIIKARKTRYMGRILKRGRYELPRLLIEGKIQGKISIGRRKHSPASKISEIDQ